MSATLNFNPIKYNSWKGKMFYQVSSFLKENMKNDNLTVKLMMKPLPLTIYRREIGTIGTCNERISLKIDETPGYTIQNSKNPSSLVTYKTDDITECTSTNQQSCINMPDMDARRRVRSSGMIRRKYNENRNNDTYCTSSSQYLVSRNRTFTQNQYNYIRQGSSTSKPGTTFSKTNVYSAGGLSHCNEIIISDINQNNEFSYTWVNGIEYSVTIPNGYYNINDLNNAFKNQMKTNTHFFERVDNGSCEYILNITYDDFKKVVVLQTYSATPYFNQIFISHINQNTNGIYNIPMHPLDSWELNNTSNVDFVIKNNGFQKVIGFTAGRYGESIQYSSMKPQVAPNYVTTNYKPNNPQFGQQGAVSSSTLVSRKRYDTITSVGAKMKAPYGTATANALAYGVTDHQYTLKDKIGFPLKKTPVISKYTGEIKIKCSTKQ